jgi:hypothetical protein
MGCVVCQPGLVLFVVVWLTELRWCWTRSGRHQACLEGAGLHVHSCGLYLQVWNVRVLMRSECLLLRCFLFFLTLCDMQVGASPREAAGGARSDAPQPGGEDWAVLEGHTRGVTSLACTTDGGYLLSGARAASTPRRTCCDAAPAGRGRRPLAVSCCCAPDDT